MLNIDTSIYEGAKDDILSILSNYPSTLTHEATLYIVDAAAISKLMQVETLLQMEYSQYDKVYENIVKKGRLKAPVLKYSLATLVKIINPNSPCNSYQTYIAESWSQVNDREKVRNRLDAEFVKHKNKLRKFTKQKLIEKGIKNNIQNLINDNIENELKKADNEREYIIANFDKLDVRISSYFERVKYAGLSWFVNKKKQTNVNLRKEVPNVLWFEEIKDVIRDDNKLADFFKDAKRAYGNIFYRPLSQDELRKIHDE